MQISLQILMNVAAPASVADWYSKVFGTQLMVEAVVVDAARDGDFQDEVVYAWLQDNCFLEGGALYPAQVITVGGAI